MTNIFLNTRSRGLLSNKVLTLAQTYTRGRACLHWPVVGFLTLLLYVKYRMKVYGREHLPSDSHSYIIASTHSSLLDPPIVSVAMRFRPIAYMAKEELFQTPLMGWLLRLMGTFPVNRNKVEKSTIQAARAVLKSGYWYLGMFPEGTRSTPGQVAAIKKGAAFIAKSAQAGIIPMVILRYGPKNRHILVEIGPVLTPTQGVDELSVIIQEQLQVLTQRAEARLK